jgi:hypothetical protein
MHIERVATIPRCAECDAAWLRGDCLLRVGRASWSVGIDNFGAVTTADATAYAYCSAGIAIAASAAAPNLAKLIRERRAERLAEAFGH